MTTVELAAQCFNTKTAQLFRVRKDGSGELDVRPWGHGSKRGWTLMDTFTASAIVAVAKALNDENRAKLAKLHPVRAAIVCFKLVKGSGA